MATDERKAPPTRSAVTPTKGDRRQGERLTKSGRLTTEEVEKAAEKVDREKARSQGK